MSDSPALQNIKQVVASFFNRSPLDSTKFMEKMCAIAVEILGDLNIYHVRLPKITYLPITDINYVILPPDFIQEIKPPSIIVNGLIYPLTELGTLPLQALGDCEGDNNPPVNNYTLESTYPDPGPFNYVLGQSGGQNICYYRFDMKLRVIVLSGAVTGNTIYLEYTSTGISLDSDTVVPRELVPVVRDYLMWQSIENNKDIAMNEKERKKEQYEESLALYHRFTSSMSKEEWEDIFYGEMRTTPKR